jgi:hypothetical protein
MRVRGLVLGNVDGSSSLAASMSGAAITNRVRWGSLSTLVAAMLHFLELKTELEVLGSRCSADLT